MSKTLIQIRSLISKVRDEKGATAVEYVLIVGGIAAVLVAAIAAFGTEITGWIQDILP